MCLGGFPHKCQLVAKGISISHGRTGGALRLRIYDSHLCIPADSELLRPHNSLMIFLRLFLWRFCFIRQQEER